MSVSQRCYSICRLLPAPGARVYRDTEGNELASDPDAPAVASLAYGG